MDNTRRNPLRRAINSLTSTASNTYNRITDALSPNRTELIEADRRNAPVTRTIERVAMTERLIITQSLTVDSTGAIASNFINEVRLRNTTTDTPSEQTASSEDDLPEYEEAPSYEQATSNIPILETAELTNPVENVTLNRNTNFVNRGGAMCRVEYFPYNRLDLELRPVSNRLTDVSISSLNSNRLTDASTSSANYNRLILTDVSISPVNSTTRSLH